MFYAFVQNKDSCRLSSSSCLCTFWLCFSYSSISCIDRIALFLCSGVVRLAIPFSIFPDFSQFEYMSIRQSTSSSITVGTLMVLVYMPDTAFLPEPSLAPPFPVFFPGSFSIGLFCLISLRNQS